MKRKGIKGRDTDSGGRERERGREGGTVGARGYCRSQSMGELKEKVSKQRCSLSSSLLFQVEV
jgi:hypothetical protein